MDLSIPSSFSVSEIFPSSRSLSPPSFQKLRLFPFIYDSNLKSRNFPTRSLFCRQNRLSLRAQTSNGALNDGFVLEDVPHLTDFLPDLPVIRSSFSLLLALNFLLCFYLFISSSFSPTRTHCRAAKLMLLSSMSFHLNY